MTIKVEQEVLVSLGSSYPWPIGNSDDFLIRKTKQPLNDDPSSKCTYCDDLDEECASVVSLSSSSMSSDDDSIDRRVSFADDVVTDVYTRPYTEESEISDLYYSTEETQRFREEYRLERKILHSLSPDLVEQKDLSEWLAGSTSPCHKSNSISRVVILHNDKLETFQDDMSFDTPEFWSGSITWW